MRYQTQSSTLISRQRPHNKRQSLRHWWLSFKHAMTWKQLKQRFHYRNIWAFIRKHWFAPTVIVLLAVIAYRHIPPFWQSKPELQKPIAAQKIAEIKRGASNTETQKAAIADFIGELAAPEQTATPFTPANEVASLPDELPAATSWTNNREQSNKLQARYIQRFIKVAQDEQKKYGIPAAITLALAIICSDFGTDDWSQQYNNHFTMRCENNRFNNDTQLITKGEDCYVKFPTAWASFRANSMLLTAGKYKELARVAKQDVETWASGLERVGYPNPQVNTEAILYVIETHGLRKYNMKE